MRYIILIYILLISVISAGNLDIKVSSTQLIQGEELRVKLLADGDDIKFPKIDKVAGYVVENIRKSSISKMQFINGQFSTKKQKILSFLLYPKKSITLPSFKVTIDGKVYKTKPINIKVLPPNKASKAGGFYIEMRVDKKHLYMGEPFILTIDVVEPLNSNIARIEYLPPKFKNCFSQPIGGEKQVHKRGETVHRIRYLLIPQKPGKFEIPPATCKIGIRNLNAPGDPFGIFGDNLSWKSIRSNSITIDAKPIPVDSDLIGKFKVSARVDKTKTEANRPINYTLKIEGIGSLEDIEDPVFHIDGVTVYSDDAKTTMVLKNGVPYSTYIKKYAFISDKSFTIPSLKLKEFDFTSKKSKTLTTRAFAITVKGGTQSSPTKAVVNSQNTQKTSQIQQSPKSGKEAKSNPFIDENYYKAQELKEAKEKEIWIYIALFVGGMISGGLLLILIQSLKNKKSQKGAKGKRRYSYDEALKILYPHINESKEVEEMVDRLYRSKNSKNKSLIDIDKMNELCNRYSV